MNEPTQPPDPAVVTPESYAPPQISYLGTLAALTQKEVGAADGTTFFGIDVGS